MRLTRIPRSNANLLVVLTLWCMTALVAMPAPASAQGTAGTLPDPITSREIDDYGEMIGLSDEQLLRITTFHEQYLEDFKRLRETRIEEFLGQLRSVQPTTVLFGDCETVRNLTNELKKLTREITALDRRLFDRVQIVLTEGQLAELPRVRQTRQRERALSGVTRWVSFLNRSIRADFSELVEDINLDREQAEAIGPALRRYERRLTRLVEDLNEATRTLFVEICEIVAEQGLTPQAMAQAGAEDRADEFMGTMERAWAEASEDMRKISEEIAQLNRNTLRELTGLLGAKAGDDLRARFLMRAYPETRDRDLNARRRLETALQSDQVTGETQQAVQAVMQQFRRQDKNVTREMMDVIDEMRAGGSPFRFMRDSETEQMRSLRNELEELEQRRQAINDQAVASLDRLLGESLSKALAQQSGSRREARGDRPRGGPRGRGGGDRTDDADASAPGSGPAGAIQDRFVPAPITKADITAYVERIGLSEQTLPIVRSLHDDYMAGYRDLQQSDLKAIDELVDEMPGFGRRGRDTTMTNEKIDRLYELRKQSFERVAEMDKRFFDDLSLIVASNVSTGDIVRLRHVRKRARYLPRNESRPRMFMGPGARGRGAEAVVDLTQLMDEKIDLTDEQRSAVTETMREYETELSNRLVEHFQTRLAMWKLNAKFRLMVAQSEGGRGWREAREKYGDMFDMVGDRLADAVEAVAQLNRETIDALRSHLSESQAQALQDTYNRRAFPDIFDEQRSAEPAIQAALELSDLTDEQRNSLFAIASSYRQRYREITDQLIELRRNDEAGSDRDWRNRMEQRNERRALEFERRELMSITIRKIRATLRDDQIERIPPLREDQET